MQNISPSLIDGVLHLGSFSSEMLSLAQDDQLNMIDIVSARLDPEGIST